MGAEHGSNKTRKLDLVKQGRIHCGRCPYHQKENAGRPPRTDRYKSKARQTIRKK